MKRLILILLAAVFSARASAQVTTTLKSCRIDDKPVLPPGHRVQGEDGTLYEMSHYTLFRLQPDGSVA